MKLLPFILLMVVFLVGCADSLVRTSAKTVERNGTTYAIARNGTSNVPYSGSRSSFYGNGQLMEKKTFRKGVAQGPYKAYHNNGQLKGKGSYQNGERHGPWEWYDEKGRLRWKGNY